jgi:hypothetical protein
MHRANGTRMILFTQLPVLKKTVRFFLLPMLR